MTAPTRVATLTRFREMIERREPIVGGGAGTGLSAKCCLLYTSDAADE